MLPCQADACVVPLCAEDTTPAGNEASPALGNADGPDEDFAVVLGDTQDRDHGAYCDDEEDKHSEYQSPPYHSTQRNGMGRASAAAEQQQQQQPSSSRRGGRPSPNTGAARGGSPVQPHIQPFPLAPLPDLTTPPAAGSPAAEGSQDTTPFDDVLEMLRQGPMSLDSPHPLRVTRPPRLHAITAPSPSLRPVAAAGTGAPTFSLPPRSPAASSAVVRAASEEAGAARRYVGSRLGPMAGQSPGGVRAAAPFGQRGLASSRFSRAPMGYGMWSPGVSIHTIPRLGAPKGPGEQKPPSPLLAKQQQQQQAGGAAVQQALPEGTAAASPFSPAAPGMAWTPMRSAGGAGVALSGAKRKAEEDAGESISILDAQRRIRQRSQQQPGEEWASGHACKENRRGWGGEGGGGGGGNMGACPMHPAKQLAVPSTQAPADDLAWVCLYGAGRAPPGSADRLSWLAGRTPFHGPPPGSRLAAGE